MKRVEFSSYGTVDVQTLNEQAQVPRASEHHVVIKAKYASLNPIDFKIRDGSLRAMMATHFPSGMAYDVSGDVVAVGSGVEGFKVGDRVAARSLVLNTLAEFCEVKDAVVAHIPEGISYEDAAALPLAGMTALQSLRKAGLKEGESVLILGGGGGVGSYAIQLARHVFKAGRVVTTASTAKHAKLMELGAHACIDYKDTTAAASAGTFDCIFDSVGEAAKWGSHIKAGRKVVSVAATPDPAGLADAGIHLNFIFRTALWFMSRHERHAASSAGGEYAYLPLNPNAADITELLGYMKAGQVKSLIDTTFVGLEKHKEAYSRLESGRAFGKVLVAIAP